jgi:molybdopterin-guanine dinucleotide biosynthesis protein A
VEKKELNKDNVVGIILSGGLSRRMGEDKSEKKIFGKSLIELVITRSEKQVQKLIINSNRSNKILNNLGMKYVVSDCIPGNLGPLVGVLTGIRWVKKNTKSDWLMSFPVDSPFFPNDLVTKFLEESSDYDILMAQGSERVHPVFSMWRVSSYMENQLYESLKNNERKIDKFTKKFKTKVVKFPVIGYDPFFNVNTPNDLKIAKEVYKKYFR